MRAIARRWFLLLLVFPFGGCQDMSSPNVSPPADTEADIKLNLARLGPDDQRIAEQQRYCPIMDGVRLGEMGQPCKVTVKGVSAFVCCENCERTANDDPDQALAKILQQRQTRAIELTPRIQ